ncbi:GNAT family N-acetyltransferase [Amphibacillus sp. Q70]|uniref:GNAT family N-acetyltransferase n=1 Tax=Amphibacillus sp. Q70 TaxID=3453416 RepID=UPI003F84403E
MILELKKAEFYRCSDLLYEQGQLEAKAVIEGVNPGRVFVDDVDSPTSGLIWLGNNDGFFFIGNERNGEFNTELNHFIDTVIKPEASKVGLAWFEAIGDHTKWNDTFKRVFENRDLGSWNQKVYTLQKADYKNSFEPVIEKGYRVAKLSERLFENRNQSIENIEFLHGKILASWSSPEAFFNKGIGYCIIHQNKVVSICFSGFSVENVHCIDIETLAPYQGKKLAQKIAHHYVKDCLENDQIPYWDCMEMNKPSVAVAESIGFRNFFNYVGYDFSLE